MHIRSSLAASLAAILTLQIGAAPLALAAAPTAPTPTSILANAPAGDWAQIDADDLLVLDQAQGGRVVILLADAFAPAHIANIRLLAKTHWYDGLAIERVQDNYVVQWGDADGTKALPPTVKVPVPAEYDRPAAGLAVHPLPYRDPYAEQVGSTLGMPVAQSGDRAWLVHCYGMVGVGRDMNPDTGTGAELYAVIGQPTRALDRNVSVIGRVIFGVDTLAAMPRGTADMGFYATPGQRLPIRQVRLAADLPAAERPRFERLKENSPSFAAWLKVRANRQDSFFIRPAGALDVCNALPPVRAVP